MVGVTGLSAVLLPAPLLSRTPRQVFCSRDPIGYTGGVNAYAYGNDTPLGNVDPLGLKPIWCGQLERLIRRQRRTQDEKTCWDHFTGGNRNRQTFYSGEVSAVRVQVSQLCEQDYQPRKEVLEWNKVGGKDRECKLSPNSSAQGQHWTLHSTH